MQLSENTEHAFPNVLNFGKQTAFRNEALKGNLHTSTQLSDVFFSQQNIDALQQGIRYLVNKKSCGKHTISNQSEDELKIVMRAMFLKHSKNLPYGTLEQVREINGFVLEYCVKEILSEIDMNLKYKQDISTLPVPLDYGRNESLTGTRGTRVD